MLKALPTDEDLERSGCADAGLFLQRLKAGTLPEEYTDSLDSDGAGFADEDTAFKHARAANWGHESVHSLPSALAKLLVCIVRTIEEDSQGADNLELTAGEIKNWAKGNLKV